MMKRKITLKILIAAVLLMLLPLIIWAANLLKNDMLEAPFIPYSTYTGPLGRVWNLQVAQHWEKFILSSGTYKNGKRLRFFSASDWAAGNFSPVTEKRDGADAQVWWSSEIFDTGIYQQVSGLTVGENYGFQAGILQVFETTSSKTHGKMFRSVGIDPFGGIDPLSSNVIWSPEENLDVDWFYPGVGAQAKSTTMTVFVRVRSPNAASTPNSNQVWVDDTFMDVAPVTNLNITVDSPTQLTANWSGTPRSGFHLFAYEAQYRKSTDTAWTDIQIFDSSVNNMPKGTSSSFTVETGLDYVVRARMWNEQDGGDSHELPGPWAEQTVTSGGIISGQIFDNHGRAFSGVTVGVTGSSLSTTSNGGSYSLRTGAGTFGLTATTPSGWSSPYPSYATVPNLQSIASLTITLRSPDDIINNGDFETGLTGWTASGTTPTNVTSGQRSGVASLSLAGTVVMSQTGVVTGSYQPALSFWYKLHSGNGNDLFKVEILGTDTLSVTNIFSTSTVGNWNYAWLPLGLTDIYTGSIGVRISLIQTDAITINTVVYIDEVSLGSWRSLSYVYLPTILNQ